jgi:hypothetical protein
MTEPFDFEEARRIVDEAYAVETELTDLSEWGKRIDAEIRDGKLARDKEAKERAYAENLRLAALCTKRALMWDGLAAAIDVQDLSVVRSMAEAIRQCAEDAFRRSWEGGCSAE